jgi:hypothetical protein
MGKRASRGVGKMVMNKNFLSIGLIASPCPRRGRRAPKARAGRGAALRTSLMPACASVLGAAALLSSCAQLAPAPAPRPVLVQVPVSTPIYCQVPPLNPPILAISTLTPDSPPADTVRSYAASVDVLKSAVRERDSLLEGCTAPTTSTHAPQAAIFTPPTAPPTENPQPKQVSIPTRLLTTIGRLISW